MGTAYRDGGGSVVTNGERSPRLSVTDAEMELLAGGTLSTAELNILDGVTALAAELNYLDLAALGTGAASKAVVLDASADYSTPGSGTFTVASGATLDIIDGLEVNSVPVTASAAELNLTDDSIEDIYADGVGLLRVAKATWDFAVDGGAQSAINLGVAIPANCIVLGGILNVFTQCTTENTDAGTGAIHIQDANDIINAVTVISGTDWDVGLHAIVPAFTAGTAKKTTTAKNITFTIGTETWTAGAFQVTLLYIPTSVNT